MHRPRRVGRAAAAPRVRAVPNARRAEHWTALSRRASACRRCRCERAHARAHWAARRAELLGRESTARSGVNAPGFLHAPKTRARIMGLLLAATRTRHRRRRQAAQTFLVRAGARHGVFVAGDTDAHHRSRARDHGPVGSRLGAKRAHVARASARACEDTVQNARRVSPRARARTRRSLRGSGRCEPYRAGRHRRRAHRREKAQRTTAQEPDEDDDVQPLRQLRRWLGRWLRHGPDATRARRPDVRRHRPEVTSPSGASER